MYFNNTTVAPTAILFTLIHSVGMPLAFIEGQHQKQVFFFATLCVRSKDVVENANCYVSWGSHF